MQVARVDGVIVTSVAHPSLRGKRLVICQPLNEEGRDEGNPVIAVDFHGAGRHDRVLVSSDGATTRERVVDPSTPLRNLVIGLVSENGEGPCA